MDKRQTITLNRNMRTQVKQNEMDTLEECLISGTSRCIKMVKMLRNS